MRVRPCFEVQDEVWREGFVFLFFFFVLKKEHQSLFFISLNFGLISWEKRREFMQV